MTLKSIADFSVEVDPRTDCKILVLHRADGDTYHIQIQSSEALRQVIEKLSQDRPIQFDTETLEIFANYQLVLSRQSFTSSPQKKW